MAQHAGYPVPFYRGFRDVLRRGKDRDSAHDRLGYGRGRRRVRQPQLERGPGDLRDQAPARGVTGPSSAKQL